MNWRGIWHLGIRYLAGNRLKTGLVVAAFTLVWLLPLVVGIAVREAEQHLRARAAKTPLLIGRTGSPLELVFNVLYFTKPQQTTFPFGEIRELGEGIRGIPVYARYHAQDHRIVGTNTDYFDLRKLQFSDGRPFLRTGECVVGSAMAKKYQLEVGDSVISSPESLFDLAGVYPLKMKICGIMRPNGTTDDDSVFVDLKTTWVIEGLGHGHDDATTIGEEGKLESEESGAIKLNASVVHYNEITPDNLSDFHFHGDSGDFPITGIIAIPDSPKAQALLKGRFQSRNDMQVIEPAQEMDQLFETVFRVQKVISVILALIGIATLVIGCLVFLLSYRLRIDEFRHLANMGADRMFLRCLIAFEGVFVLAVSWLLTLAGLMLAGVLMSPLLRTILRL